MPVSAYAYFILETAHSYSAMGSGGSGGRMMSLSGDHSEGSSSNLQGPAHAQSRSFRTLAAPAARFQPAESPVAPCCGSGDPELRVAASLFDASDSSAAAQGGGKQRTRRWVERTPEEQERSRQARNLHWQVVIIICNWHRRLLYHSKHLSP
jgi:hypothetical protein